MSKTLDLSKAQPPLTLWWCLLRKGAAGKLRRLVVRGQRSLHRRQIGFWLIRLRQTVVWPLASIMQLRSARATLRQCGEAEPARLISWLWDGLFHGVRPEDYLRLELYRPENRRQRHYFIYANEVGFLSMATRSRVDHDCLRDKFAFWRRVSRAGLNTPAFVGRKVGDRIELESDFHAHDSWFGKPARGHAGLGCLRFERAGSRSYLFSGAVPSLSVRSQFSTRTKLSLDELLAFLARAPFASDLLIQPAIANHNDLKDLTLGGLGVIRLLTARWKGRFVPVAASYCMPVGQQIVSQNGIFAPVDLADGKLGVAADFGFCGRRYGRHPDTGALIEGRTIPLWSDCMDLASSAHALFPGTSFIGWDLAPSPEGAVLIEGNLAFDPHMLQKSPALPLLKTIMADVLTDLAPPKKPKKSIL